MCSKLQTWQNCKDVNRFLSHWSFLFFIHFRGEVRPLIFAQLGEPIDFGLVQPSISACKDFLLSFDTSATPFVCFTLTPCCVTSLVFALIFAKTTTKTWKALRRFSRLVGPFTGCHGMSEYLGFSLVCFCWFHTQQTWWGAFTCCLLFVFKFLFGSLSFQISLQKSWLFIDISFKDFFSFLVAGPWRVSNCWSLCWNVLGFGCGQNFLSEITLGVVFQIVLSCLLKYLTVNCWFSGLLFSWFCYCSCCLWIVVVVVVVVVFVLFLFLSFFMFNVFLLLLLFVLGDLLIWLDWLLWLSGMSLEESKVQRWDTLSPKPVILEFAETRKPIC